MVWVADGGAVDVRTLGGYGIHRVDDDDDGEGGALVIVIRMD